MGDATAMSIPDQSVDLVVSDLPFGRRHGSVLENQTLYPQILLEVSRVLRPSGRVVLLTGEESISATLHGAVESGLDVIHQVPLLFGGSQDTLRCILICL